MKEVKNTLVNAVTGLFSKHKTQQHKIPARNGSDLSSSAETAVPEETAQEAIAKLQSDILNGKVGYEATVKIMTETLTTSAEKINNEPEQNSLAQTIREDHDTVIKFYSAASDRMPKISDTQTIPIHKIEDKIKEKLDSDKNKSLNLYEINACARECARTEVTMNNESYNAATLRSKLSPSDVGIILAHNSDREQDKFILCFADNGEMKRLDVDNSAILSKLELHNPELVRRFTESLAAGLHLDSMLAGPHSDIIKPNPNPLEIKVINFLVYAKEAERELCSGKLSTVTEDKLIAELNKLANRDIMLDSAPHKTRLEDGKILCFDPNSAKHELDLSTGKLAPITAKAKQPGRKA